MMMQQADELKSPSFCMATAVNTHTEEYQRIMAEHVTLSAFQSSLNLGYGSGETELATCHQTLDRFFICNS